MKESMKETSTTISEENTNDSMLETMAFEQIKMFMSSEKGFFTSSFIGSIVSIALSQKSIESSAVQQSVSEMVVLFSQVYDEVSKMEKKYGEIVDPTVLNMISVHSLREMANRIISDSIPYSPFTMREIFREKMQMPEFYSVSKTNSQVIEEIESLLSSSINVTQEIADNAGNELRAKSRIMGAVRSVEAITNFVSSGANQCANINEYLERFSAVAGDVTSLVSSMRESRENNSLTEIFNHSFYDTVVKENDTHIRSGISSIDAITNGGPERGRIYLFSAKTGGGKSTVLMNLAHGMHKAGSGLFLPDVDVMKKLLEDRKNPELFAAFFEGAMKDTRKIMGELHGEEYASKKHLVLYVSLENLMDETYKRYFSRTGLIPPIFWVLARKDKSIAALLKKKGFLFTREDLPSSMSDSLKDRLAAMSFYCNLIINKGLSEMRVWWAPPYSISAREIYSEIRKLERDNFCIDAVIVDYPDKMRPVSSDITRGDQSWDTLGKIFDNLKALAKQANVPVIMVSQFTRQGNKDSGNRGNVIKAGNTAGSQQKENNTDTVINMNIYSKDDDELQTRHSIFRNYQVLLNKRKARFVDLVFKDRVKALSLQQSNDILEVSQSIPDIETINSYVQKNRDGMSDITFEMFIIYGLYFVTDYSEEAVATMQFVIDTHIMIMEYMQENGLVDKDAIESNKSLTNWCIGRLNRFAASLKGRAENDSSESQENENKKSLGNNGGETKKRSFIDGGLHF